MELKKFDEKPYLQEGEKTVYKARAPKTKSLIAEMIVCYIFWLLSLSGGCFIITAGIGMTQYETHESGYILITVLALVVNMLPFGFWLAHIFKNMYKRTDRWYVLTDKRLLTITENKPNVVTVINLTEITEVTANKKAIFIVAGEVHFKVCGVSDVTAFLNRLEIVVFGDETEESNMMQELQTEQNETQENGEANLDKPEVWVE